MIVPWGTVSFSFSLADKKEKDTKEAVPLRLSDDVTQKINSFFSLDFKPMLAEN